MKNKKIIVEKEKIKPCEHCDNELMFELGNGKSNYAVSIEVILTCLQIAESQRAVPKIDDEWWLQIVRRFKDIDSNFTLKMLKDSEEEKL